MALLELMAELNFSYWGATRSLARIGTRSAETEVPNPNVSAHHATQPLKKRRRSRTRRRKKRMERRRKRRSRMRKGDEN